MPADAYTRMAHLLRRAAFGARPNEINSYLAQGFEATVDQLVNYQTVTEDSSVRSVPSDPNGNSYDWTFNLTIDNLADWWIERMIKTRRPLQEKMTLFWHDHFATSYDKVTNPKYLWWQNQLVRDNATGNIRFLLKGINHDPATIIWLDSRLNTKTSPNENYARELMELFSLGFENSQAGTGIYTEADVQQAARAFTGWGLKQDNVVSSQPNGQIVRPDQLADIPPNVNDNSTAARRHDYGTKTVFEVVGNFNGDDIVDLILDHEPQRTAAARFFAKKFWEYFAYEDPEPHIIDHLAAVALRSNFEIKPILRDLFINVKEFYSDRAMHALIKWPIHFTIGAARLLQATVLRSDSPNTNTVITPMLNMGQWLFRPPDVSGWPGGTDWISSAQILARTNWANSFATNRNAGAGNTTIPVSTVLATGGFGTGTGLNANPTAEEVVDYFINLLIQRPLATEVRQGLVDYMKRADNATGVGTIGTFSLTTDRGTNGTEYKKVRGLIHLLLARPEFQNW
jgi:uncharacterized protein (DUF1800 family)